LATNQSVSTRLGDGGFSSTITAIEQAKSEPAKKKKEKRISK
jgi:hypothetical protein